MKAFAQWRLVSLLASSCPLLRIYNVQVSCRWIMHLTPPPARKMIDAGVPIAVASDFNPNAYCMSMPFVMNVGSVCELHPVGVCVPGHDDE